MKISMEKEEWELDPRKLMINKLVGVGGFGFVYQGYYNGKKVAVKIFDLGHQKENSIGEKRKLMEEIFMQEVSIWCDIQHPNIAQFIGAIKKNNMSEIKMKSKKGSAIPVNGCCIVVEYVGGGTLKSYLSKYTMKKNLPLDTILQLALDVAKGLSYLHSEKIAHRDVKTENLLVDKTGRVKIIDFGISSHLSYSPMMVGTTGTIGYMAPEVLSEPSYDHKCDVYSFGICLWEMYSCLDPYPEHISRSKISHQIYKDRRPEIPKSCPTALSNIMKKCWDVKPQNRPEMKEVVHMLEAIQTRKAHILVCLKRRMIREVHNAKLNITTSKSEDRLATKKRRCWLQPLQFSPKLKIHAGLDRFNWEHKIQSDEQNFVIGAT